MAWPSGKAEACKASIPSSNLGATLLFISRHPVLYLIATPIGNLADITFRAIEILKICDYILCEDTRHSSILLSHYEIRKPLKSYHKFNESFRAESAIEDLKAGMVIGLISDAGTPGISDPGSDLVRLCIEHALPVSVIPGPCAAIHALTCSGLPTDRFQFWGFLEKRENDLRRDLQTIFSYHGTTICYESPHRLLHTLKTINELQPERPLTVGRELTKKFEEFVRGTAEVLLEYWKKTPVKGEIVLLIAPPPKEQQLDWSEWPPEEHVRWFESTYNVTSKEAIKYVAELRGVPKRHIYSSQLKKEEHAKEESCHPLNKQNSH